MKRWTGVFLPQGHSLASRFRGAATIVVVGLVLAACSSSTSTGTAGGLGATGTPASTNTPAPTATPAAVVTPTESAAPSAIDSGPTGVPTSLDPCVLVPAQEASQVAGATFGAGKEETTSGNGRICVYGGQTLNVFEVIVGQAPDAATAQAAKAEAEAQIQSAAGKAVQFTELPGFADGAAYTTGTVSLSGQSIGASGFYFLKGVNFVGFSDLAFGHAALTAAALQAEATAILGRLP